MPLLDVPWPVANLEELTADGESITYGVVKPGEEDSGGVAFIRGGDIVNGRILTDQLRTISPTVSAQYRRTLLRGGELLVSLVGNPGQVALVPSTMAGANIARQVGLVRLSPSIDAQFALYYLSSPMGQAALGAQSLGSVQQVINLRDLKRVEIPLPPLDEQRAIAAVLGSLDDKIEQNRRTGAKLEGLARGVFKAWFVDFEPVKAKAAGATAFPGMPPETFAALPTRLTDSELGPVPEGWEVGTIKERASVIQYGLTTSAATEPVGPRFLRITDIRGGAVNWNTVPYCVATAADSQKYRILDGDIVVARTGASTGENLYIVQPPESVFASYLVRFQFAERAVARIIAEFMRTETYQSFVKGTIGGSAQPNANAQMLAAASLVFPPLDIAKAFYEVVHLFDLKMAADARESAKLATLRDYLLPRLLSGRVRVEAVRG